ncbi:fibronectin-like isoform X2 [Silurus meridionalis]|uniref:Fibronectin type-III domain-containing protein n=1 Tax=Silurus meridionalis TaxID=175797 RepID=A0A8T0BLN1_SILME|nr:fibronectin-like isoform X2 [Silurus meridionalis]KAF7708009.1 hypothetical protein HF521_017066 [Silurus meridionalis]
MRSVDLLLICCSVASLWRRSSLASPPKILGVAVKARSETLLTLEWSKAKDFSYILGYGNGTETPLTVSAEGSVVRYTVSSLSPGTKYSFVLYAVFKGVRQSAFNFTAVTSPSNVANVSVKARSETAITFEWRKVNSNNAFLYVLKSDRSESYTPMYWGGATATHTVTSLSPGNKYNFTLYTLFGGERSSGYNFSAVTMPPNVAKVHVMQQHADALELSWEEVKSRNISYILRHSSKYETTIPALEMDSVMTHTVSSLSPGTRYIFTLYTVYEGVRSRGLTFTSITASVTVTGLRCERISGGHALVVIWDAPSGQWTGVEVQMNGRNSRYLNGTRLKFDDLHPAFWYDVTLKLVSGTVRSVPATIRCQTDPRGVIAGVVLVLLFLLFFICLGLVNHRRKTHSRSDQTSSGRAEEGAIDAPARVKAQSSDPEKPPEPRVNKKRKEQPVYVNPYATP